MKSLVSGAVVGLSLALASGAAAHAFLDHAEPRVGSTVAASPAQVRIWFNQDIEPAFSALQVFDAVGRQVDKGDRQIDPSDASSLVVSLAPLGPGSYKVVWRAVSVDTHITEGNFIFRVAP